MSRCFWRCFFGTESVDDPLDELIEDRADSLDLPRHRVMPSAEPAIGIDCGDPSLRSRRLHFRQFVESLRLEDEIRDRTGLQPDEEIRHVVVGLTVVQIRNPETQASVLHKSVYHRMRVDVIRRLLLPFLRIGDDVVQVTANNFADVLAGPVVDVRG